MTAFEPASEGGQTGEALRLSQQRYRALVEATREIIATVSADGTITSLNPAFESVTGWSRDEWLGKHFASIFHPDDQPAVTESFEGALKGEAPPARGVRALSKSGQYLALEWALNPLVHDNNVTEVLCTVREMAKPATAGWTPPEPLPRSSVASSGGGKRQRRRTVREFLAGAVVVIVLLVGILALEIARQWTDWPLARGNWEIAEAVVMVALALAFGVLAVGKWGALARETAELARAEEALGESEANYRHLVETARDVIYTLSADGVFTSLNPAFEAITGWSRDEWVGKPFAPIIHPDDLATGVENFRRILRRDVPPVSELRVLTKSGEYAWGEFSARPLVVDGEVAGSFGIVRDISDRKRAEEALRESEKKYRDLVENINETIYEVDATGRITYMSPVAEEAGDYALGELRGRSFTAFVHPDDLGTALASFEGWLRGDAQPVEFRLMTKSGEARWHRSHGRPIVKGGRSVGVRGVLTDISDRKRAEEALKESEERFRSAFDHSATGMALVALDGRMLRVNRFCCETLGYSEGDLTSTTWQAISHPDDLDVTQENVRRVLSGESESFRLEKRFIHKDGHVMWGDVTSSLLRDCDGKPLYFITQIQDITERKRADEALRESEERFRELVEKINEAVYEVDATGRMTYMSPTVENIGGYAPSEIIGRTFVDFVHGDDLPQVWESLETGLSGNPRPLEFRTLTKSGEVRWVHSFARPIVREGQIVGLRGVLMNITDRKRAEEELRKLSLAVEQSPASVIITDLDGCIEYVNPKFTEVTGYSLEEVLGENPRILKSGETPPEEYERLWRTITSGGEWKGEFHNKKKNGELYWESASISSVKDSDGAITHFLAVKEDITERKGTEEALRESEERYRHLVELSPDAIAVHQDGKIVFANTAAAKLLRAANSEQLTGKPIIDIVHPDYHEMLRERVQEVVEGRGAVPLVEEKYVRIDGTSVDVEVTAALVSHNGRAAVQSVVRDITERKRAEAALRESEEKYRELVENLNDIIYEVDSAGRITYVSSAAEGAGGYSRSDITGRLFTDFIHPDDMQTFTTNFQEATSSGVALSHEYRLLSKTGAVLWFRTNGRPVFEGDRVVGFRGILTDITERKQVEEALQNARAELEGKVERQMLRRNPYDMTFRELTVLNLVVAGETDRQIGLTLGISHLTAQKHISNILSKMNARSRTDAGVRAVREGLLD